MVQGFRNFGYDFGGVGEVFEGDSADMCTGKFPLVSMGGRANGQAWADGERGPPSARAEIPILKSFIQSNFFIGHLKGVS